MMTFESRSSVVNGTLDQHPEIREIVKRVSPKYGWPLSWLLIRFSLGALHYLELAMLSLGALLTPWVDNPDYRGSSFRFLVVGHWRAIVNPDTQKTLFRIRMRRFIVIVHNEKVVWQAKELSHSDVSRVLSWDPSSPHL